MRWRPDVLDGFEQATFDLEGDDDGPVVATLVRRTGGGRHRRAVLYVHGYNDYFFQSHLAQRWESEGYDFYALDLRRCGRSWRSWQLPHYVDDLRDYRPELTVAAAWIRRTHDELVVNAHSTGGLTASLWAHSLRRKVAVDALVLNSPWFDLASHWFDREVATRLLDVVGPLDPHRVVADSPSRYAARLHVTAGGEWSYDPTLKSPDGVPVRAGWLRAVRRGHARLARGLRVRVPVLVCTCDRTGEGGDTVLDVAQIAARADLVGPDVTLLTFADGEHDLALSPEPARSQYFDAVFAWLRERLPEPEGGEPRR